jgi:hypothetical protein
VEIIGESVEGRDIHLVVATSPMTDAEWADWQELSDLRTDDPDAAIAALEAGEYDDWKSPLMVNNTSTATSGRAPTRRCRSSTSSPSRTTPRPSSCSTSTCWCSS